MSAILTELELGVRYTWGGLDKQVIKRSHVFAANLIRKAVHYGEGDVVKFGIWTERQPAGTYSSYGRLPRVRRKAVKRANSLLDMLEDIQADLLIGQVGEGRLNRAISLLQQAKTQIDPELEAIVADIELRVRVELAKLGRYPET
jgi:hypothetical protein